MAILKTVVLRAESMKCEDALGGDFSLTLKDREGNEMFVSYDSLRDVLMPELRKRFPEDPVFSSDWIDL